MKIYLILFLTVSFFLITACDNKKPQAGNVVSLKLNSNVEVIQFHSEHRCATCLKIEMLTKATLEKYFSGISFRLINVDDKANKEISEQFEAFGTSLYIYNTNTGQKKSLTDFAFMNAHNEEKYEAEMKKIIEEFLNS